jgi:hypothetical protein
MEWDESSPSGSADEALGAVESRSVSSGPDFDRTSPENTMLLGWGICLVVIGSALNELAIGRILHPSGSSLAPWAVWAIRGLNVACVAWGAITIVLRQRMLVKKINLALFSLAVLGPVAAEVGLRISFLFPNSPTRNPELFRNYYYDDDYWRLQYLWHPPTYQAGNEHTHSLLGWCQTKVSAENPLGLFEATQKRLVDDGKKKILFYGDSYVAGFTDNDHRLPVYMGDRMPGIEVLDLGVGGYGTDQCYLLFRETWRMAGGKPRIIMGVLTEDMDRSLLNMRTWPKPLLQPGAAGRLQPREPLPRDPQEWLEKHPLAIKSYFACLLLQQLRSRENNPRKEEVMRINRHIIEAVSMTSKDEGLELLYVIFYGPAVINRRDWREEFLKEELGRRSIRYLDTRLSMDAWCRKTGRPITDLYAPDGHHNNLGNSVIGDALIETMTQK